MKFNDFKNLKKNQLESDWKVLEKSFEFEGFSDLGNYLEEELDFTDMWAFQKDFIVLDPEISMFGFESWVVNLKHRYKIIFQVSKNLLFPSGVKP